MGYTVIKTYKIKQDDKRGTNSMHSLRDVSDVLTIGAQDFMPLTNPNGNLMTMFAPGGTKPYWPKGLLSIIKDARNAKTDEIMAKHLQRSDPMSEQAATLPRTQRQGPNCFMKQRYLRSSVLAWANT